MLKTHPVVHVVCSAQFETDKPTLLDTLQKNTVVVQLLYKCFIILDHFIHRLNNKTNPPVPIRDSSPFTKFFPVI